VAHGGTIWSDALLSSKKRSACFVGRHSYFVIRNSRDIASVYSAPTALPIHCAP
jgi:hypothetical protein